MRSKFPAKLLLKGFFRTPDIISPLLRGLYHKHRGVNKDYERGDGKSSKPPFQVSIRITNVCNHRCAVCGQYGKNGYMHGERGKSLFGNIPYRKYKEVVDQLSHYKPVYYFTGGEPFLYPDFVKLVNYIKQKGSMATVVTNGVKLKDYASEIVRNRWDMVLVSFDGPEYIHDECRGLKGAYKTAVEGLCKLRLLKKASGSRKPYIFTSLTLSPVNVDYLQETFELNRTIVPDLVVVYLSWFTAERIGREHGKIIKEKLDADAFTWQSYAKTFSSQDAERFSKALKNIRRKSWPFEYIVVPDLHGNDVRDYYLYPEKTFGYKRCPAPFVMMDIMPNGDITTCRDFIDVKVGNINEAKILDIWNGEKMIKFRKLLIKHDGVLPQCTRCCGLMGF
ncbi:MAG: radical SAM protein [Candidatus Omnitrophica bacterium]|nr:radical SAM protein [Candidatus Omnitrophota bacterium]